MTIELVFIPSPGIGHLKPTVKLAKQLIDNDDRISITVIIIPSRNDAGDVSAFISSLSTTTSHNRLRYESISVKLQPDTNARLEPTQLYIEKQKPRVREAVTRIEKRLAGFVVDMFCCSMIDIANEFNVPTYMLYTSNAAFLGITLHFQLMFDEKKYDVSDLDDSVNELDVPCVTRPYPVKCLPHVLTSKEWSPFFLAQARYFRKMKGILVNTVAELEPHALKMFNNGGGDHHLLPQAYPVGPVLDLENGDVEKDLEIYGGISPETTAQTRETNAHIWVTKIHKRTAKTKTNTINL